MIEALHVPHTKRFTVRSYEQHPYKYTFYGLKSLCESYGVEVDGLQLEDKDAIKELPTPFVADYANDYVLVREVSDAEIKMDIYGAASSITTHDFLEGWGGHVLLFHANDDSIEPDYQNHKKSVLISNLEWWILTLGVIVLCAVAVSFRSLPSIWEFVSMILSAFGVALCTMLLLQQLKVHNSFVEGVCSAFKHSSCNNVLETKAAKVFGRYSWAEIGFCYFAINLICLLFSDRYDAALVWLGILAFPYSIWSVWYQKHTSHWCPLCLAVQGIIIVQFFCSLAALDKYGFDNLACISSVLLGLYYILSVLLLHKILVILKWSYSLEDVQGKYQSMKLNEKVFQQ